MAQPPRWQDSAGLETISNIVKKVIPTWTNGLHAVQLELVSAILDGGDVICFTATGDGKSAAFAVPSLVLQEYNKHPEAYAAGLPTRTRPIGVVITPTKGLADNIVCFFCTLHVPYSRIWGTKRTLFIHNRIKTHQGCQGTLAKVKSLRSSRPDARHEPTFGQASRCES